jgi:hypothetical protein
VSEGTEVEGAMGSPPDYSETPATGLVIKNLHKDPSKRAGDFTSRKVNVDDGIKR